MRVTVKLFAVLRERAGVSDLSIELAEGETVATAVDHVARRLPQIAELLSRVAFAVNCEYVAKTAALSDGDELAAIPPVSGGLE
jgi:molybdopterin converting factor subunit 1